MRGLVQFLATYGRQGGAWLWKLFSSSQFQTGAFLSWLAFDDNDDDAMSGLAGATVGFGLALLALAAWLAFRGAKRVLKYA